MKSKKELIAIAMSLDTDRKYEQLYEFASKYLNGIKQRQNTKDFFDALKTLANNSYLKQNASVIGFEGNNNAAVIKSWCSYILSHKELASLGFDELHYVMGYCARLAKIHKEGC